jgi:hypothetical protein
MLLPPLFVYTFPPPYAHFEVSRAFNFEESGGVRCLFWGTLPLTLTCKCLYFSFWGLTTECHPFADFHAFTPYIFCGFLYFYSYFLLVYCYILHLYFTYTLLVTSLLLTFTYFHSFVLLCVCFIGYITHGALMRSIRLPKINAR